jgi:orotidine-5'-phosphate decarboxylase
VADGADLIVLGRAVTAAADSLDALDRVIDEIEQSAQIPRTPS